MKRKLTLWLVWEKRVDPDWRECRVGVSRESLEPDRGSISLYTDAPTDGPLIDLLQPTDTPRKVTIWVEEES